MSSVNVYARFPFVEVLAIGNLNQFPQEAHCYQGILGEL